MSQDNQDTELNCSIGDVVNGIVPVTITNLDKTILNISNINQEYTPTNAVNWEEWIIETCLLRTNDGRKHHTYSLLARDLWFVNIDEEEMIDSSQLDKIDRFFVKVPFYLMSYQIEFKFRVIHQKMKKELNPKYHSNYMNLESLYRYDYTYGNQETTKLDGEKSIINNTTASNSCQNGTDCVTWHWPKYTKVFTVEIPSLLMDTQFKVGQSVIYVPENNNFTEYGMITSKRNENEFVIEIEDNKKNNVTELIVSKEQIRADDYDSVFVINTCNENIENRLILEYNLILQTENEKIRNFYQLLRNIISNDIYKRDCAKLIAIEDCRQYEFTRKFNFDYISGFISYNIIAFIVNPTDWNLPKNININSSDTMINYNGKIRCLNNAGFDSGHGVLHYGNGRPLWHYKIGDTIEFAARGEADPDVDCQDVTLAGWSCDLCRISISYDDWCFHCQYEPTTCGHDYCLQCVYTMANEIVKFEKFLAKMMHQHMNQENFSDDCIQIIVTFVVGCVKKIK